MKMVGLTVQVFGPKEYLDDAKEMEANYFGIHRKAIWDKVIFPSGLLSCIASSVQKPFLVRKHERLVDSFREKRKNPGGFHLIDKVAQQEDIGIPKVIKSSDSHYGGIHRSSDGSTGFSNLGHRAGYEIYSSGVDLKERDAGGFNYVREHGSGFHPPKLRGY
jgi:hypothetical protein